jgi:hypothetical protein
MADLQRKPWLKSPPERPRLGEAVVVDGQTMTLVARVPFFRLGELLSGMPQDSLRSGLERLGYLKNKPEIK